MHPPRRRCPGPAPGGRCVAKKKSRNLCCRETPTPPYSQAASRNHVVLECSTAWFAWHSPTASASATSGGDGSALRGGDQINDCYVADYNCDGVVDRMVDWIDNDNDGVPDEMDIRYFTNGALNYCWFGADYDHDGKMWSLTGYEYGGPSFFEGDPYGNNMIWMNKFNPRQGTPLVIFWVT